MDVLDMKKIVIAVVIILCAFMSWQIFDAVLFKNKHRNEYLSFWIDKLKSCKTVQEVKSLPEDLRPDLIVTRSFSDGSWLAAVTTSMDQRRNFNAALLYDSKGKAFSFTKTFSGYEGLHCEINNIKGETLTEFYANASNFGLKPFP